MFIRTKKVFSIKNHISIKKKLFLWSKQFNTSLWLDSNNYKQNYTNFDACLAVEEFTCIKTDHHQVFEKLKEYQSYTKDYIFGYISYDTKNATENLRSKNFDGILFDDLYFFQPQKIIFIKASNIEFHYLRMIDDEIEHDFNQIINTQTTSSTFKKNKIKIQKRISKEQYTSKVNSILKHILRGDIYEANFCQEFFVEDAIIDPYQTYQELNAISTPPFATFLKTDNHFLISASPERYLKKEGQKIISQPIKGTAKRDINNEIDLINAQNLANNIKEQSENIMIVDLVRNDLSKTAQRGSVTVEELCKIYSFKQVHQLISTVVSKIDHTTHPVDVIKNSFPMGSMTGAPKISAMKIIEQYEETKRGLYSGAVGYFTPENDFDFNVIIRSILYNKENKYLSFSVGGAITAKSEVEKEYEECLIKAKAIFDVLQS